MNTNEIIAWSLAAAAVAFVVLCIFLISLLKTAQRSLLSARSAVDEVKQTIEGLQGEIRQLAETINEVTTDVKGKLQATNPLFDAVQDVGLMLREVTGTAREASRNLTHAVRRQAAALDGGAPPLKWVRWISLGTRVLSGLRRGWNEHGNAERQTAERRQPELESFRVQEPRENEIEHLRH
ncbi:DUF948 domain-containing protein [Cohnella pontilimi]|uniref:DUF948 domain-containing protein n=1 Tax=Cohnella pontilimi TaxID=2564100 RepID=UPI00145D5DCB|nr:DUF948 domain-containing protein [Cohnella pontilimi]